MDDLMLHGLKAKHMHLFQAIASISYFTWPETFPQKMPALHETLSIPWKCFPHRKWCNYHHPNEEQDRGHSEAITPNHSKRMQKFLWNG